MSVENKKIVASFPLTLNADGTVSLAAFDGGAVFMERLAEMVKDNGLPANAEIRVTVEAVRSRGRYSKWSTITEAQAGQIA